MPMTERRRMQMQLVKLNCRFVLRDGIFVIDGDSCTLEELLDLEAKNNLTLVGFAELRARHLRTR
jgi:7-keto-8-aminopelargonate synthetase-like enzyme